jgi:hypothetical protein
MWGTDVGRSQAYHGLTLQTMSATSLGAGYWNAFEPRVPGFVHVQYPHSYRFQGARPGETVGQAAAREIEEAILREGADTVAAVVGEPIRGAGGVFYPTDDYWPLVRELCTRHNFTAATFRDALRLSSHYQESLGNVPATRPGFDGGTCPPNRPTRSCTARSTPSS